MKKIKAVSLQVRVQVTIRVRGRALGDQITEDLVGEDSKGRGNLDPNNRHLGVPFLPVLVRLMAGLIEEYVIKP